VRGEPRQPPACTPGEIGATSRESGSSHVAGDLCGSGSGGRLSPILSMARSAFATSRSRTLNSPGYDPERHEEGPPPVRTWVLSGSNHQCGRPSRRGPAARHDRAVPSSPRASCLSPSDMRWTSRRCLERSSPACIMVTRPPSYGKTEKVLAVIESMNGARFVHDTLELLGWSVEIADARKVKGLAPLACKTDRIDARVLAELSRRDLVPAIWLPDPAV
jgi:hypothetical protein